MRLSELVKGGYDREYRIKDRHLQDLASGAAIRTSNVHVDTSVRFETGPDGGDGSNVYTIADLGTRGQGMLVEALDTLDQDCSRELFERLTAGRRAARVSDQEAPSSC